ncbi:MAG: flagellar motor protein MotD [Gammaproteobacteria bacterium]|nr:flagellar motor protein MotD [Gammaproteobacteria bacterium]
MPRKKRPEEHVNLERWLISYADFITLLFAFFVVMYAISSVNEGKYRVLSDTLNSAFQSPPRTLQPVQVGESGVTGEPSLLEAESAAAQPETIDLRQPEEGPVDDGSAGENGQGGEAGGLEEIAGNFERALLPLIEKDLINITRSDDWVEVEINSSLLYGSGRAELEDEALPVLRSLAAILRRYPNQIQVEGFTDNLPISTYLFPSNWELSAARAAGVVHLFMRSGVAPERMSAIGFAEFHPIADNATAEGRRKNRRVVLVIMSQKTDRRTIGGGRGAAAGEQG